MLTEISAADFRTAAMWAKQTAHRWSILWCAAVCVVALPVSCSFAQTSNAKSDAQVYLFRGFMNVFSLGMDGFEGELVRRGIRATTQNHLLWSIAADEAAQSYKQGHVRTIITMGHSLGAPAVISFVERLGALGVPVSLAVTLDGGTGTVSAARVDRFINLYISTGLDGRVTKGPRFQGTLSNVDLASMPNIGHFNIDKDPAVHNLLMGYVNEAVGKRVPRIGTATPVVSHAPARPPSSQQSAVRRTAD